MTLKRIQEIIAARFAQLNGERVARADDIVDGKGNPIDQVLIAAIDRIVPLLMDESKAAYDKVIAIAAELNAVFGRMVTKLRPMMEKLCAWSYQESALIFTRELPRSWLAAKAREKQRAMAEPETPLDKIHEMSKEQYEKLIKRYVFPPRSKADVAATMNRDVITVTSKGEQVVMNWEERILDLSRKVDPVKVAKEITESMELGESAQDLAKRLLAETKGIGASAKRIARTESMRQMGDSAEKSYEKLGDIYVGLQRVATMDEVVRPEHAVLNGQIWWRDGRLPDVSTMARAPIAANCLLPGSIVSGRFKAVCRSHYSGQVVELVTSRGQRLSVTVNHPIATDRGFIAAGMLTKGERLLCNFSEIHLAPEMRNVQNAPASIDEVFRAFNAFGSVTIEGMAPFNFHGDAAFMNGNVEIVKPDWKLLFAIYPEWRQRRNNERLLDRRVLSPVTILSDSLTDLMFCGIGLATADRMGVGDSTTDNAWLKDPIATQASLAFSAESYAAFRENAGDCGWRETQSVRDSLDGYSRKVFFSQPVSVGNNPSWRRTNLNRPFGESRSQCFIPNMALPSESHERLTSVVASDEAFDVGDMHFASIGNSSAFNSVLSKPAGESFVSDMELFAQLLDRFPGGVEFDDLIEVNFSHYCGPVYDAETDVGYFFADSISGTICCSNCRCMDLAVLSTPKEALNDPNWLAQIQKAGEQAHPDAATMDEWWATTDEGRQKLSVGARRFEAVQKLVGNRATTWADFVQPNGRIMTIKELQAESDVDREKRRFAISAAIQEQGRLRRQVTAMGFVV